jgi:hypothetical protein
MLFASVKIILLILSVADLDPVHFNPKDPDPGSGMFFPDPGSRILTTSQIQYIFKILPSKMAKNRKN